MQPFPKFPKIPRWLKPVFVTEKIDGTNGLIFIGEDYVSAGSRSRWIAPGKEDNFGFAGWVHKNENALVRVLGPGYHYGEWWGVGIQRGYDLDRRHFSLFNVGRWKEDELRAADAPSALTVVPTLRMLSYPDSDFILEEWDKLRDYGSVAAPGYMNAEGIMLYHSAANQYFKFPFESDAKG